MIAERFKLVLTTDIMPRVEIAFEKRFNQGVKSVAESLNVPVTRNAAGRVIARSRPGEPPRRETGALRAGAGSDVDRENLEVSAHLYCVRDDQFYGEAAKNPAPADLAIRLELGIGLSGPRPYMRPEFYRMIGSLGRAVAAEFS